MFVAPPQNAHPIDVAILESDAPEEVLYEAESPIVFTLRTKFDQQMLSYLVEETAECQWILLAPCSTNTIRDLVFGKLAVRDALLNSWLWLAQRDHAGVWNGLWSVNAEDIPQDHLPCADTLLYAELEPVLSTRVVGAEIEYASTPASVIAYAADSIRKAIKTLLEHELELDNSGRPTDNLRELYDLPAQRLAFNSFEISFSAPKRLVADQKVLDAIELLQHGLAWASSADEVPLAASSDAERGAVLKAILELTPPSTGPIEQVEVGGRWLPHGPTRLTRASRRRVRGEIKRLQVEKVVTVEGRVGELDRDNRSFILRDTSRGNLRCLVAEDLFEDLFDDILESLRSAEKVTFVGVERAGKLHVSARLDNTISAEAPRANQVEPRSEEAPSG
jgi:hypothetical protein